MLKESELAVEQADWTATVAAGDYWLGTVGAGDAFRITDLKGNQAVDTLFFNAENPHERYSAVDTIREQGNLYLTSGTTLLSDDGNDMLDIIADTCGRHDTLGGACAGESNTVRYALEKKTMHSCRDSWLLAVNTHDAVGAHQAGPDAQHQFLHERAGDSRGWPDLRGRHQRARASTWSS